MTLNFSQKIFPVSRKTGLNNFILVFFRASKAIEKRSLYMKIGNLFEKTWYYIRNLILLNKTTFRSFIQRFSGKKKISKGYKHLEQKNNKYILKTLKSFLPGSLKFSEFL